MLCFAGGVVCWRCCYCYYHYQQQQAGNGKWGEVIVNCCDFRVGDTSSTEWCSAVMVKEADGWERRGFVFEVEGLGVEVGCCFGWHWAAAVMGEG